MGQEQVPQSWGEILADIFIFSTSCNALMLLSGVSGCGKTTFTKILQERKPAHLDIVPVSRVTSNPTKNWLIDAITPWITSDKTSNTPIAEKIKSLAEIERPILIVIDTPSLDAGTNITPELIALLNLADGSNLKLSILVLGSIELASSLGKDLQTTNRIVLNSPIPALDTFSVKNFVINKIQNAGITSDQISIERAQEISQQSGGIPGIAIQLIANELGFSSKTIRPIKNQSDYIQPRKKNELSSDSKKLHKIEDLLAPSKK